ANRLSFGVARLIDRFDNTALAAKNSPEAHIGPRGYCHASDLLLRVAEAQHLQQALLPWRCRAADDDLGVQRSRDLHQGLVEVNPCAGVPLAARLRRDAALQLA